MLQPVTQSRELTVQAPVDEQAADLGHEVAQELTVGDLLEHHLLAAEGTPERMFVDMMHTTFATQGMAPATTAGIVLDAIKNDQFCILTHPEHNARLAQAHAALLEGAAPLGLAG